MPLDGTHKETTETGVLIMANFEKFNAAGGSFSPKVSLRMNGSIGLSQGALRKFGLDKGRWWVVLFYDKDAKLIGIHPTENESEDAAIKLQCREVTAPGGKTNLISQVSAKAFLEYFSIPYKDQTRTYVPTYDANNKMIIIDLKSEKLPVRRKKGDI
jgi:hypothetical protein